MARYVRMVCSGRGQRNPIGPQIDAGALVLDPRVTPVDSYLRSHITQVSRAHRVVAGVGVGGVGRDDVRYPAEQAPGADPKSRRDDQPQDAGQDASVVELPDTRDDRTQNGCQSGITHSKGLPPFISNAIYLSYVR